MCKQTLKSRLAMFQAIFPLTFISGSIWKDLTQEQWTAGAQPGLHKCCHCESSAITLCVKWFFYVEPHIVLWIRSVLKTHLFGSIWYILECRGSAALFHGYSPSEGFPAWLVNSSMLNNCTLQDLHKLVPIAFARWISVAHAHLA